jgi:hypothetical protein
LAGGLTFVKEVKRAYGQNEASVAQAGAIAVLGFTLACVPTVILYADVRWSPQRAVVCMARGEPIAADYIGEASDRIYLGERFLYKNKKERARFCSRRRWRHPGDLGPAYCLNRKEPSHPCLHR